MIREFHMVTEREVRYYVESRTLAAKLTGIFTFITMLLCLLMDMLNMPSGIRIHLKQDHARISAGCRDSASVPAFFSVHY
jgi:cupin superfamily acireductone dioxygenase involved in methionine salvage